METNLFYIFYKNQLYISISSSTLKLRLASLLNQVNKYVNTIANDFFLVW